MGKLTDRHCRNLTAPGKHADGHGLYLHVTYRQGAILARRLPFRRQIEDCQLWCLSTGKTERRPRPACPLPGRPCPRH